jgi:hypothetical protein
MAFHENAGLGQVDLDFAFLLPTVPVFIDRCGDVRHVKLVPSGYNNLTVRRKMVLPTKKTS